MAYNFLNYLYNINKSLYIFVVVLRQDKCLSGLAKDRIKF